MKKPIFITGISTEIGKTICSAIITEALEADYWKPVQSGALDFTDSMTVQSLISNPKTVFHPEAIRLTAPLSPHASATLEGMVINENTIKVPFTSNQLIIEGAGGLMVPLNDDFLMIDLIQKLDVKVILISKHYLGSINHTLLSAEALKNRNIEVLGIVFNGDENPDTERVILRKTGLRFIGRVNQENEITKEVIRSYSNQFKDSLNEII